jgi:DNA invertase Pin-like site-specific DNA recombinase
MAGRTERVAIYARFSSDKQSDTSIEDQVRRCRDHIARTGGDPTEAVVFPDFAVSGASLARPGFEAMMAEVEAGTVSVIVTEDLSRISRDFADAGQVYQRLRFLQVPLIGVADGIDTTTASGFLTYGIKSVISAHYLAELGDKTHRGLEGRFRAGLATGAVPFGYRTERTEAGSAIRIDEASSAIVRDVFRAYATGKSFNAIAADLNARGTPTPRKRSRGWAPTSIRSMLDNEKYAGRWSWNKTQWVKRPGTGERVVRARAAGDLVVDERPELAIIGPDLWAKVRARRDTVARAHRAGQRPKSRRAYALSGILHCAECGAPLTIYGGSRTAKAYRCPDGHGRGSCANRLAVREEVARGAVLAYLRHRVARPAALEHLRQRAAAMLSAAGARRDAELEGARRQLEDLQGRIGRLVASVEEGTASASVNRRIVELEAAELQQRRRVTDLRARARGGMARIPDLDALVARTAELERLVERNPAAGREKLRAIFGGRIDCHPRGDVYVARATILPGVLLAENVEWRPGLERHSSEGSGGTLRSVEWQGFREPGEFLLAA